LDVNPDTRNVNLDTSHVTADVQSHRSAAKSDKTEEKKMSVFKKREKKDGVKPKELRELAGSQTEDVGVFTRFIRIIINIVKDASITLKSAFRLKDRKTGDGDDRAGN
jgi:hypothetical protein